MKKYLVVTLGESLQASGLMDKEELLSRYTQSGESPRGGPLRAELQGEPRFLTLVGPMWGGRTKDGIPIVRYEDAAANDMLSR